jgi:hypothetical protein
MLPVANPPAPGLCKFCAFKAFVVFTARVGSTKPEFAVKLAWNLFLPVIVLAN